MMFATCVQSDCAALAHGGTHVDGGRSLVVGCATSGGHGDIRATDEGEDLEPLSFASSGHAGGRGIEADAVSAMAVRGS